MGVDISKIMKAYQGLSLFNKIALWGSIASIIGLFLALPGLLRYSGQDSAPVVNGQNTTGKKDQVVVIERITERPSTVHECPYDLIDQRVSETPKGDPEEIPALAQFIRDSIDGTSDACRSSALQAFIEFNRKSISYFNAQEDNGLAGIYEEAEISAYNRKLAIAGWELGSTEGTYYVQQESNWIRDSFDEVAPNDWREYLHQRAEELSAEFTHDAFLLIPFDDLRKRIVFWEAFLDRYPLFALRDEVEYRTIYYLAVYLSGTDNSRVYEIGSSTSNWNSPRPLKEEVRNSYQNFLTVNHESKYYPLVRDYYAQIKSNNFLLSDEFIAGFLDANLTRTGRGIEFPRR